MSEVAVRFDDIRKSYGETVALRGVSLEVRRGEVFGLLGPNGAGKTSLIRILLDIIRADDGAVHLFGEPLTHALLDRVGYLPEERGLYKKQKIVDVLAYFGRLHGLSRAEARQRSLAWLERIGLPEVSAWKVDRLSKGMSQKVQVAGTLLFEPDLCVLDEPFTGLDPVNVRLVQELIGERRAAGMTTILSTHRMNAVEELCDRVALIDDGSLVVYGDTEVVRREHSSGDVRVTLAAAPPLLEEILQATDEGDGNWLLRPQPDLGVGAIVRALVSAGVTVQRVELVVASMEDVFVHVVQQERQH